MTIEDVKAWLAQCGRTHHLEKTLSLARPCYRLFFDQKYQEDVEVGLMPMLAGAYFDVLFTFTSADNILHFKHLIEGFDLHRANLPTETV